MVATENYIMLTVQFQQHHLFPMKPVSLVLPNAAKNTHCAMLNPTEEQKPSAYTPGEKAVRINVWDLIHFPLNQTHRSLHMEAGLAPGCLWHFCREYEAYFPLRHVLLI